MIVAFGAVLWARVRFETRALAAIGRGPERARSVRAIEQEMHTAAVARDRDAAIAVAGAAVLVARRLRRPGRRAPRSGPTLVAAGAHGARPRRRRRSAPAGRAAPPATPRARTRASALVDIFEGKDDEARSAARAARATRARAATPRSSSGCSRCGTAAATRAARLLDADRVEPDVRRARRLLPAGARGARRPRVPARQRRAISASPNVAARGHPDRAAADLFLRAPPAGRRGHELSEGARASIRLGAGPSSGWRARSPTTTRRKRPRRSRRRARLAPESSGRLAARRRARARDRGRRRPRTRRSTRSRKVRPGTVEEAALRVGLAYEDGGAAGVDAAIAARAGDRPALGAGVPRRPAQQAARQYRFDDAAEFARKATAARRGRCATRSSTWVCI